MSTSEPILELQGLKKYFPILNAWKYRTGWLKALDDVTLDVAKGEILGIVGESGCGKSTLGKTVMGIHRPSGGRIIFEGNDITDFKPHQSRELRRDLQYTYQDPGASLDPRWKIGKSLEDPPESRWKVRRDGGDFDQFTGATITPRIVVEGVRKTLLYYRKVGEELFRMPSATAEGAG